ncbi:hypothetical protein GC177_10370 [bacterium]|nr:hypothetical protein [bacterium]
MALTDDLTAKGIPYRAAAICLMRTVNEEGRKVFCYLKIYDEHLGRFALFLKEDGGLFNPADYGEILAIGFDEPDDDTRRKMKEEFGYDESEQLMLITPETPRN